MDANTILPDAESLLGEPQPKSESDRKAYRARLLEMEGKLTKLAVGDVEHVRVLRCLARVANARGHHKGAIQIWERLLETGQNLLDEANLALGIAHARVADLDAAKEHIDRVSIAGREASGYEKEKRAVETRISINKSITIAETIVRMADEGGDSAEAERLIDSALMQSGLPYRDDDGVRGLLKEAFAVISKMSRPAVSEENRDILANYIVMRQSARGDIRSAKFIFSSGFLWSGSGAVTDFLSGHDEIHIAFKGRELTLFNYLNTLLGMFDSAPGKIGPGELMGLFLGPIAGLLADRKRIYPRRNSSLFKAQWDVDKDIGKQVQVCCSLVAKLSEIQTCRGDDLHQKMLYALMEFANDVLDSLVVPGKKWVLLNNCIFGYHVREISIFRNVVMIAVRRDPRDQYISQYYEMPPADVPSAAQFVKASRRRLMHYRRTMSTLELGDRVIEVWFEDFVENDGVRRKLTEALGLTDDSVHCTGAFDPSKSSKNVGLYKSFHDTAAILAIENGLPEFLHPPIEP